MGGAIWNHPAGQQRGWATFVFVGQRIAYSEFKQIIMVNFKLQLEFY